MSATKADFCSHDVVAGSSVAVPVAKPRLPSADELLPYLRRIDQHRWYSNGGALVQEFEARLADHAGGGAAKVATVANATLGLTLALLSWELPLGGLCMVPAWTFAATAHAIQLAGLVPWIVDVSRDSWALEAAAARELLHYAPGPVSAVMPVSPFGAPIDLESWERFHDATGIAVVVDAAASFDTVRAASVPAVVSLHATKVLGVGEGGFVISNQSSYIEEIQKRANFGFWNTRESTARSFNGKLSEYGAAVGLAALDSWSQTRADFLRVGRTYGEFLPDRAVGLQSGFARSWVSSTVIISSPSPMADTLTSTLARNGIGSRRWWGGGLHRHAALAGLPRHTTTHTDWLVERVIGLPCWRDLPNESIRHVCDCLRAVSS